MRGPRGERGRGRWWAFWVGLAISIGLHAALLVLLMIGQVGVRLAPRQAPSFPAEPRWEEALRVVPTPPRSQRTPAAGVESERAGRREPGELPTGEPVPAPEGERVPAGGGLTNAERLRPRIGDRRLWSRVPVDSLAPGLGGRYDRAEAALRRLVKAYLDSLRLSEEQRRRAREWLVGEGDDKWGVTPEGLHLGDVTIPIPFGQLLSRGGETRREAERARATWEMIQFQAGEIEAEEVREERLEAIRERTGRRREGSGAGGASSDTAASDTTGS